MNGLNKLGTFLVILTIILAILIVIEGIKNFLTKDYLSLGDPYYKSQILAFERAPIISKLTLVILGLILTNLVISGIKKYGKRFSDKK